MAAAPFRWTDERKARLVDLYVGQLLSAGDVAARFTEAEGFTVAVQVISRQVIVQQLAKQRPAEALREHRRRNQAMGVASRMARRKAAGLFIWTDANRARLRELYLVQGWTSPMIAEDLGCAVSTVRGEVSRQGLPALRAPGLADEIREAARRAGGLKGAAATSARFREQRAQAGRPANPGPRARIEPSRHVGADLRALIDAAIADGRVTRLPAGTAAGLTTIERQFYAAPAHADGDWKAAGRRTFDSAQQRKRMIP